MRGPLPHGCCSWGGVGWGGVKGEGLGFRWQRVCRGKNMCNTNVYKHAGMHARSLAYELPCTPDGAVPVLPRQLEAAVEGKLASPGTRPRVGYLLCSLCEACQQHPSDDRHQSLCLSPRTGNVGAPHRALLGPSALLESLMGVSVEEVAIDVTHKGAWKPRSCSQEGYGVMVFLPGGRIRYGSNQ